MCAQKPPDARPPTRTRQKRLTYLERRARASDPPPKATGARARDIRDDVDRLEHFADVARP